MAMMELIPLDERTKPVVLSLMNSEHPDAIHLYARHFGKQRAASAAELVDVTERNLSVRYTSRTGGGGTLTMPYEDAAGASLTVRTIGDCRRALVGMARVAAAALGEEIELPEPRQTGEEAFGSSGGDGQPPPTAELVEIMTLMKDLLAGASPGAGNAAAGELPPVGSPGFEQAFEEAVLRRATEMREAGEVPPPSSSAASSRGVQGPNGGAEAAPPGAGVRTGVQGFSPSKPTQQPAVFAGTGSKLGSSADSSSTLADKNDLADTLREVDPERPLVQLQVRLLSKALAKITVNRDFTVREVRAWLAHYMGESCQQGYHLMDQSQFPPKKFADLDARLDELGLTKPGTSLTCRPA